MPTEKFFNLPKDKQDNILTCAFNEFSENDFDKASIFSIAQKSGFSRSSFYCYFKDKNDIYKYLVYNFLKPKLNELKNSQDKPLNFLPKSMFEYLISFYGKTEQSFVQHLLKNMNPENIHYISYELQSSPLLVNCNKINLKTQYDLYIVSTVFLCNMAIAILNFFDGTYTKKEAEDYFDRVLQMLENSVKGENLWLK